MNESKLKYKRLPGRTFLPFVGWSLWQGKDHLLWVSATFFRETYKRFYYNDVQSVVLQETASHWIWTFVWGALALLFGLVAALVVFFDSDVPYATGTMMLLFIIAVLINLSLGRSCTVYLQTAVHIQKLSCLRRVRTAQKALNQIKTLVEQQQGPWEKQKSIDAQDAILGPRLGTPQVAPPPPTPAQVEATAPKGPYKPWSHYLFFALFFLMGALGSIQMWLKLMPVAPFQYLLHAVAQIMALVVLVVWFRHLKGTMIAKFNWVAITFVSIQSLAVGILYYVALFQNPELNYNYWALFKMMFDIQMNDHPVTLAGNIIYGGGSMLIGVFGLMVVQRNKDDRKIVQQAST